MAQEERKNPNGGGTANRGFASMDPERQREIARKGGATVSQNREHMAQIGRRGGEASGHSRSNRAHQNQNSNDGNPLP
jgi:general stress protein YciG